MNDDIALPTYMRCAVLSVSAVLSPLFTASASATGICDGIVALAATGAAPDLSELNVQPTGTVLPKPVCGRALGLSGKSMTYCSWSFDYRSPAAKGLFDGLFVQMVACFGPEVSPIGDARVNHPDSYDLRIFDAGEHRFNLSLKDKGVLNKSLVFLRVERGRVP